MGYKSFIRSASASSKRLRRETEKKERAQQRELQKVQTKLSKLDEKQAVILDALEDAYVKGRVSHKEYKSLKERIDDIELDLLVFGSTPAMSLAKQYVSGKIDKGEFEKKKMAILPEGLFLEREEIKKSFSEAEKRLEDFLSSCKTQVSACHSCGAKKGLFKWLYPVDALQLCGRCKTNLIKLKRYDGFDGQYFFVDSANLFSREAGQISVEIKKEHLLNLR